MTQISSMFRLFFAAMMLAVFASPTGAANPEKIYSINVSAFGISPVAVTIKNETPNGNSTVNSFVIRPPAGVTVTIASPTASSAPATVTKGADGNIYVSGFTGLQAGNKTPKTLTVYLNASYGASTGCGAFTWTATVYAGNAFGSETFAPVVGTNPPTNASQTSGCNYSLNMAPASLGAGTSTTLTATLKNESVAGNPPIVSATLTAPAGLKITGVTAPAGTTATFAAGSVTVSTTNIAPSASVALTIAVDTACVASSGNWGSSASSSSGAFSLLTGSSSLGTAVTGACSLAFQQQPSNVTVDSVISPPMVVVARGSTGLPIPWFTGPVTLNTGACGSGQIASVNASGGTATFSTVVFTTAGTYTLTACSTLGTSSTTFAVASNSFTVFDGGPLNCAPLPPYRFSGSEPPNYAPDGTPLAGGLPITESGYAEGQRGEFNKDGPCSAPVAYTFANNILAVGPAGNSVTLRWDTASQPGASFLYTMTWLDEIPDLSSGVPTRRTKVAWEFDGSGNPSVVVYGVACLSPGLPAPYGNLTVGIDNAQTTIAVTSSATLPPVPFPAAIGNERIQVTAVSGSTWTVVRGTGNLGADKVAHSAGAYVMSTPLPIDPNQYKPGTTSGPPDNPYYLKQAQVCIADEGWVAVGGGKVRFTTTVFDIGDAFVRRDL